MQATVATFDDDTRAGTVVTDQGRTVAFGAESLADHIRHLRPGQRVHLDATDDRINRVSLW